MNNKGGGRLPSWRPGEGQDKDALLPDALSADLEYIGLRGNQYKSRDMNVGIDVSGLVLVSKTAQKLVAIDTRGGYFSQDDIETPLTALLSEEKWNAAVTQLAAKQDLSRQAYIADQAYVIRVQLSHIRIKKAQYDKLPADIDDGSSTSHPPALVEVYKLFTAQTKRNLSKSTYTKSKFPNLAHLQVLQDEADVSLRATKTLQLCGKVGKLAAIVAYVASPTVMRLQNKKIIQNKKTHDHNNQ